MKVLVFSVDEQVLAAMEDIQGDEVEIHEDSEVLMALVEKCFTEEEPVFIMIDLDHEDSEKIVTHIAEREIPFYALSSMSLKEIKKVQKKKDAADGYLTKPIDEEKLMEVISDFKLIWSDDESEVSDDTQNRDITFNAINLDELKAQGLDQVESESEPLEQTQDESEVEPEVDLGSEQESHILSEDVDVEIDLDTSVMELGSDIDDSPELDLSSEANEETSAEASQDENQDESKDESQEDMEFDFTTGVDIDTSGLDKEPEEVDNQEVDNEDDQSLADEMDFSSDQDQEEEVASSTELSFEDEDSESEDLTQALDSSPDLEIGGDEGDLSLDLGETIGIEASVDLDSSLDEKTPVEISNESESDVKEELDPLQAEFDNVFSDGEKEQVESSSTEDHEGDGLSFDSFEIEEESDNDVSAETKLTSVYQGEESPEKLAEVVDFAMPEEDEDESQGQSESVVSENTGETVLTSEFMSENQEVSAETEKPYMGDIDEPNPVSDGTLKFDIIPEMFEKKDPPAGANIGEQTVDIPSAEDLSSNETENFAQEQLDRSSEAIAQDPVETGLKSSINFTQEDVDFARGDSVRFQGMIKELRKERESLLKDLDKSNNELKIKEQENLSLRAELDEVKIELSINKKRHAEESNEWRISEKVFTEKKDILEEKIKSYQREIEKLNSKVRIDFNKIKQREKELESKLELMSIDTENQIQARDGKIIELKRKIDALEFNVENSSIIEQKAKDDKAQVEDRLQKIMKTLRQSIQLLEDDIEIHTSHILREKEND